LKTAFNPFVAGALSLAATVSIMAAQPALADVAGGTDISGKVLYVKPGSWLRYSDSLISRVYTTTKATLEVKGRGACTARLCPVTHNNVDLWTLRSRLDLDRPATGTIVTERTLRNGDEGADVKIAQDALVKAGYKLTADGKFGADTEKAVAQFQEKNGLDPDGDIGPATRIKLKL
jgi:murein L,D-transpeptidase YcbB/YkuD